jgi:hypothetical protein
MDHQRTLETTLELVPDDFDDATHARLDRAVLNALKGFGKLGYSPVNLLAIIVETSQGILDPKYSGNISVMALLHTYPQLEVELENAWEQEPKSFRNIRNLSTCGIILSWQINSRRYRDSTFAFIQIRCAGYSFLITSAIARPYRRSTDVPLQIPVAGWLTGCLTIGTLARHWSTPLFHFLP